MLIAMWCFVFEKAFISIANGLQACPLVVWKIVIGSYGEEAGCYINTPYLCVCYKYLHLALNN